MRVKFFYALAFLFIHVYSYADVPNSFVSGSPAIASDVNENFEYLDQQIDGANTQIDNLTSQLSGLNQTVTSTSNQISSIDRRLASAETDISSLACVETTNGDWSMNVNELNYEMETSSVGDLLVLNNTSYRIAKVPFREFGSGDLYTIKLPLEVDSSGNISQYIYSYHLDGEAACTELNISGFPARGKYISEFRTIRLINNGSSATTSNIETWYRVNIKVDQTSLAINFNVSKQESSQIVPTGDYNFVDELTMGSANAGDDLVDQLDDLIDYIVIEKVN